jgi:hypothetical protein
MLLQLPESMIRDTVAAVFRDRIYQRTTLLQRIGAWLLDLLEAIFLNIRPRAVPTYVFWTIAVLISLALLVVLARWLYPYLDRRSFLDGSDRVGRGSSAERDLWSLARAHAAAGDYTAAAHTLYAALLGVIARRGEVELHESKTIGDYLRELAARSSATLARFREFARSYETVIYGIGYCDRDRYERLLGLAQRIAEAGG